MENSITESDWLFSNHPTPNAKFPPVTTSLNRFTYHKVPKPPLYPVPKSHGHSKSMNKLPLNEPAICGQWGKWEKSSKQYQEMFYHTHLFLRNLTTPIQNV